MLLPKNCGLFYSATVKLSTRRYLFYGLMALFLVMGLSIVLYAQGWRLDLTTGRVSKIGAVFVRSFPDDADIFLNGKPATNQSGFLSKGTLISDLFPKSYSLKLSAPGYDVWHEAADVLPSLVTPFKYAVLIPQNAATASSGTVRDFLEYQGVIATESPSGTITADGTAIGKGTIVSATTDRSTFVFRNANGNYYLYNARGGAMENISGALAGNGAGSSSIQEVMVHPDDPVIVIAAGQKKIWLFDASEDTVTQIEKTPATQTVGPWVAVSNSLIAWTRTKIASGTAELMVYDQFLEEVTDSSTTIPGTNSKLAWINSGLLGMLQADGSLYLYNTGNRTLKKLADDATDFSATTDGTAIAVLEHKGIEIFSLNDPTGYYRFNIPDSGAADQLIWYKDGSHLFVAYPDHVSFLDLSDLSLNNFTTVGEGTAPVYDPSQNSLYLVSATGTLMRFDFPN